MGQQFSTVGDIGYRSAGVVIRTLLDRGYDNFLAAKFGQPFTQPKNATLTAKFARYNNFPTAEAPLSEGITPPGQKVTKTDVILTLRQFGDWAELTDLVFDTHEDDVPAETVNLCADQYGETVEVVTISPLKGGTNVFYANNAGSRAALTSPPLAGDLKRIERFLAKNKGEKITDMIGAGQKISTEPIPPTFVAMGHTDLKSDIEAMEGFIPIQNYATVKPIDKTEIGSVGAFRFCLTRLFSPWLAAATSATGQTYLSSGDIPSSDLAPDVYPIIVVAKNSYGVIKMKGPQAIKPAVVYPKPTVGNELAQRGFVSWKCYYGAGILNQAWCIRYEVCCTAMPS